MAFSTWIKLLLLLILEFDASLTVEGERIHPSKHHDARHWRSKSGQHSAFGKENTLDMKHKESRMLAKKSYAPFHAQGAPLVHIPVVQSNSDLKGDGSPEAQPERGSFKIDDSGVIGGGTYEITDDGVDVDINLKIPKNPPQAPKPSTPKLCPMPCPQPGQPAPGGGEAPATPAPGTTKPTGAAQPTGAPEPTEATQPTPPAGGGGGGSDFENEGLNEHNKFRKVHGVPPLTLDAEMSKQAAAYAQKIAQMGTLQHASSEERNGHGENLSMGCSSDKGGQTAKEAVTNWYNEVCSPGYTFGSESGGGGTGHFTQVVWKESKKLGMGKADSEENGMKCTYIVGRYDPAGNMMGAYAENVPKGSFDQSYCSSVQQKRSGDVWKSKTIGADLRWNPRVDIPEKQ